MEKHRTVRMKDVSTAGQVTNTIGLTHPRENPASDENYEDKVFASRFRD